MGAFANFRETIMCQCLNSLQPPFAFMNPSIVARKLIISMVLSILAIILFFQGASAYQGLDWPTVRAVYLTGAAIVFAIAIIPWMTKE